MVENCCPVPLKKLRVLLSSESSENEELNLSQSFNDIYKKLMEEEMVAICMKQFNSTENLNPQHNFFDFQRKYNEFQQWIETAWSQNKNQCICRSDTYLEKVSLSRQVLQSSKFAHIKMLGNMIISGEPNLQETVNKMISDIEHKWHSYSLFTDLTISHALDDINEDVDDILTWLSNIKQKLNFDIRYSNRKRDIELLENILREFEIHNRVCLAVVKVINELQDHSSPSLPNERINILMTKVESVQSEMYQQWLNAIEYKLKIQDENRNTNNMPYRPIGIIGQESGFESELSPMYNVRKMCKMANNLPMKYISSADDLASCTTALPSDTESADISIKCDINSSSTLYSSTETMSEFIKMKDITKESDVSPKRIIRRKKRRSKRPDKNSHCYLSTEDSESCLKVKDKFCGKRHISETSHTQLSDRPLYSPHGLNYTEIANVAERLVRKNSTRAEFSTIESPKESEIEDLIDAAKNSLNDIDVDKNWDYYQASMYSNEDGDSEIIEVDKIRDWEHEMDSDGVAVILASDNSKKTSGKRLSLMTSGYETNWEIEQSNCAKSLICVLQFTTSYHNDINKKMNAITDQMVQVTPSSFDSILRVIADCDSTAQIHLTLLRYILNNGPCSIVHNTTLIDNLNIMETRWEHIKDKCDAARLRAIENKLMHTDNYRTVEELKCVIESLQDLKRIISAAKIIHRGPSEHNAQWRQQVEQLEDRVANITDLRVTELKLILRAIACVAQSKCTRKLFASELRLFKDDGACNNVGVKEIYDKFEKSILSLKKCMESLNTISSMECQANVSKTIEDEIRSWNKLCDRASNLSTLSIITSEELESLHSGNDNNDECGHGIILDSGGGTRSRLMRHLPMHMAIIVVVAMIGLWCNQLLSSDCHSSSVTDWIQLLYRYNNNKQPH